MATGICDTGAPFKKGVATRRSLGKLPNELAKDPRRDTKRQSVASGIAVDLSAGTFFGSLSVWAQAIYCGCRTGRIATHGNE
jgi:hypothetical protein